MIIKPRNLESSLHKYFKCNVWMWSAFCSVIVSKVYNMRKPICMDQWKMSCSSETEQASFLDVRKQNGNDMGKQLREILEQHKWQI